MTWAFSVFACGVLMPVIFVRFAVTVTALAGMVKLVLALFALANVTAGLAVQFLNCCPAGGVPALMLTVAPSA